MPKRAPKSALQPNRRGSDFELHKERVRENLDNIVKYIHVSLYGATVDELLKSIGIHIFNVRLKPFVNKLLESVAEEKGISSEKVLIGTQMQALKKTKWGPKGWEKTIKKFS